MRIGLIGLDGHVNEIIDDLPNIKGSEFTAVAKARPEDGFARIENHPAVTANTRRYDDPLKMLDEEKLDIVGICPPNYLIAPYALAAMERGVHVMAEKPLAIDLNTLARIRASIARHKVRLAALFSMRQYAAFLAAHNALREGLIGEPILATAQKSYRWGDWRPNWYSDRATYGGTIPWIAIHAIDYVRWTTGQEFKSAMGYQSTVAHKDYGTCEDNGGLVFQLNNGGTAVIHFDYLRPAQAPTHGDDRLRIAGSRGIVEVKDCATRAELTTDDSPPGDLPLPAVKSLLRDFIESLENGAEPCISAGDSLRVTEIALKARDAADEGRIVNLE